VPRLTRRYQVLSAAGWCEDCEVFLTSGDDTTAEKAAAEHARGGLGHRVRVIQSRLVIIGPQPPEVTP